ncbi:NAD kinase [Kitasatospora sp. MAP5-34]|nr:NAD kinase [Kitasatospora sp. MAP5-34]
MERPSDERIHRQSMVTGPEAAVDELDLALVNALQLQPRAPWSLLGQTLGISPVTAARRWRRLSEAGIAWVTADGRAVRAVPMDIWRDPTPAS